MVDDTRHPDEATWERLASGELDRGARDAAFDHILTCERCALIWRGVLALKSEAQSEGLIPHDSPASNAWFRSPLVGLAIAATLLVIVGGVYLMRRPVTDVTTERGSGVPPVEGLMMAANSAGVPMLVWAPIATASGYNVEVFTDDGRPAWTRNVSSPPVRWPDDVARTPGKYHWRVEALIGAEVVARSRLATLEIKQ
jgi:hypothetical protein